MLFIQINLVLYHFLKTSICFWLGIHNEGRMYYAGYCLWTKPSFRLPRNAGNDRLIGLRTLFRTLKALWKINLPAKKLSVEPTAIMDYSDKNEIFFFELKKLNVEHLTKKQLGYFILKNHIMPEAGKAEKMLWSLFIGFYSFPIVLLASVLSSRYRANAALIITEIIETIHLLGMLKKYSIREVYDFHPYEIDSNVAALILMNVNIRVIKMPSPGPLALHNDILIANALVTSTPYHQDEINYFQKTMFVDEIIPWIPERALTYIGLYAGKNLQPPKYTIGFYSHASWVREMEGHIDDGMHVAEAENMILSALKQYLSKNQQAKLIIFPHPREKTKELIGKTQERYEKILAGLHYEIFFSGSPSSHVFDKADVGIISFSTIVYERLFCGFKTLLFSFNNDGFPIDNSALNNICVKDEKELLAKLDSALGYHADDFFSINNISNYTYHNFNIVHIGSS